MKMNYLIALFVVLNITGLTVSKSIQNITSLDEDSINSRLELLEAKMAVLENESKYLDIRELF